MVSILFILLAASSASLANLLLRKNSDRSSSLSGTHFYLLSYYAASFFLSFVISPSIWQTEINWVMVSIGSCVGALNVVLMLTMSRALRSGPSGLTFAFQNASAVFPGVMLCLLFGSHFGFSISYLQIIGIILVVYGLFAGTKKGGVSGSTSATSISRWLIYALACCIIQIAALTLMQGRCVLFEEEKLSGIMISLAMKQGDDAWFMPAQFGTAFILQALLFARQAPKIILPSNAFFGFTSGLANGACTFLLLLSTKLAADSVKVILFPCFAVLTIVLCNLWSSRLYKEKFNYTSNILCSVGILLGLLA